jgi:hypothetical protein
VIALFYLAVTLLSFTRVPMWAQVTLLFMPPVAFSVWSHDAGSIKVTALALVGAFVIYMPVAFLGSFFIAGGIQVAFRRLRFIYFVFALMLFVVLVMNMTQLIGII